MRASCREGTGARTVQLMSNARQDRRETKTKTYIRALMPETHAGQVPTQTSARGGPNAFMSFIIVTTRGPSKANKEGALSSTPGPLPNLGPSLPP